MLAATTLLRDWLCPFEERGQQWEPLEGVVVAVDNYRGTAPGRQRSRENLQPRSVGGLQSHAVGGLVA